MNNNIICTIMDYIFSETICVECDNSLVDKLLIFRNIKNIQVKLCDYHNIKKLFLDHVSNPENIDSDNSFSFHNNSSISKEVFRELVIEILNKNGINRFFFCCSGGGVMYEPLIK